MELAVNLGRPVPLHGQVAERRIGWELTKRRALRDGSISHAEALDLIQAGDAMADRAGLLASTTETVLSALAGSRGDRSPRFLQRARRLIAEIS